MSSPTIFAISQMRHNLNFQKKYNDVNFYTTSSSNPLLQNLKILVRSFNFFFVINPANLRYQTQVGGKQYYKLTRNLDCLRENLITQSIFSFFFFFETTSGDLDKETGKVPTSLSPHTNHRDTHRSIYWMKPWESGAWNEKKENIFIINPDTQKYLGQQQQQQNCLCFYTMLLLVCGVTNPSSYSASLPYTWKSMEQVLYVCSCCYPEYWSNKYLIETWIMHGQCRTRRLLFAKRIYISNVFSHQILRFKKLSN